jgi:hypothetical protein
MRHLTSYRRCEIFGKNFQKDELWAYFDAFYRNHFLYVKLKFSSM